MKFSSQYLFLICLVTFICCSCSQEASMSETKGGGTEVVAIVLENQGIELARSTDPFRVQTTMQAMNLEDSLVLLSISLDSLTLKIQARTQTQQLYWVYNDTLLSPINYSVIQNHPFTMTLELVDQSLNLYIQDQLLLERDISEVQTISSLELCPRGYCEVSSLDMRVFQFDRWQIESSFEMTLQKDSKGETFLLDTIAENKLLLDSGIQNINQSQPKVIQIFEVQVGKSSDDAEEQIGGSINLTSHDIDMMEDLNSSQTNRWIGVRFENIPSEVLRNLTEARIQWVGDDPGTLFTELEVYLEEGSECLTFQSSPNNLSQRILLKEGYYWSPPEWIANESSDRSLTQGLQGLIKQQNYETASSSLCFLIRGFGNRDARSYDNTPSAAPRLILEYSSIEP